jgi:hypothetical protein
MIADRLKYMARYLTPSAARRNIIAAPTAAESTPIITREACASFTNNPPILILPHPPYPNPILLPHILINLDNPPPI